MKTWTLTNPNQTLVKSAKISQTGAGFWLNVETVYGHRNGSSLTLRGIRTIFGRELQAGGKWRENPVDKR